MRNAEESPTIYEEDGYWLLAMIATAVARKGEAEQALIVAREIGRIEWDESLVASTVAEVVGVLAEHGFAEEALRIGTGDEVGRYRVYAERDAAAGLARVGRSAEAEAIVAACPAPGDRARGWLAVAGGLLANHQVDAVHAALLRATAEGGALTDPSARRDVYSAAASRFVRAGLQRELFEWLASLVDAGDRDVVLRAAASQWKAQRNYTATMAMARQMTNVGWRDDALFSTAISAASHGEPGVARAAASEISVDWQRAWALGETARGFAELGLRDDAVECLAEARQLLLGVADDRLRLIAAESVVGALLELRHFEDARVLIDRETDSRWRRGQLNELYGALRHAGLEAEAKVTLSQLEALWGEMSDPFERTNALARHAQTLARDVSVDEALAFAAASPRPLRGAVKQRVVEELIRQRDWPRALEVAKGISETNDHDYALRLVVEELATRGDFREALEGLRAVHELGMRRTVAYWLGMALVELPLPEGTEKWWTWELTRLTSASGGTRDWID